MPSIKAESVCFSYGDAPILKDIDLEFDGPGLYCIIGPNGVGKSTLIKCMNGLLEPTSGRVMVNGRDVSECSVKELSKEICLWWIRSSWPGIRGRSGGWMTRISRWRIALCV